MDEFSGNPSAFMHACISAYCCEELNCTPCPVLHAYHPRLSLLQLWGICKRHASLKTLSLIYRCKIRYTYCLYLFPCPLLPNWPDLHADINDILTRSMDGFEVCFEVISITRHLFHRGLHNAGLRLPEYLNVIFWQSPSFQECSPCFVWSAIFQWYPDFFPRQNERSIDFCHLFGLEGSRTAAGICIQYMQIFMCYNDQYLLHLSPRKQQTMKLLHSAPCFYRAQRRVNKTKVQVVPVGCVVSCTRELLDVLSTDSKAI